MHGGDHTCGEGGSAGVRKGREGVNEGGEAGRGRAWSKGMDGVLEGGKEEGGRQGDNGVREGVGDRRGGRREGREGGREGDTNAQCQAWVMHRSMPVVDSIHSVLTCWWEGLRVVGRARRGPWKEGGTSCC